MSEEKTTITRKLKHEIDELMLQLSLGKAEASDFIEEQKGRFKGVVDDVREKVAQAETAGSEAGAAKVSAVRQKLDELNVQLALGRMETREAYEEQKEKIGVAIDSVREGLKPLEEKMPEALKEAKEKFDVGAEGFKAKLDTLALNLGVGKIIAEDELALKKDELKQDLKEISSKLVDVADVAEEGMRKVGHEAMETLSEIRKKLLG